MYTRILVPLDGSKEAEHALPHVKTAATGYDPPAKVILFSAIEPFLGVVVDSTWSKEYDKRAAPWGRSLSIFGISNVTL